MAPELLLGSPPAPPIDIYSLGVTLFEMVSRARFGWAGEDAEGHERRMDEKLEKVDMSAFGDVAEETGNFIRAMMAYDPDDRPDASGVVHACRQLEKMIPTDQTIEEWAEEAITPIAATYEGPQDGELTGQTLTEDITLARQEATIALEADPDPTGDKPLVGDTTGSVTIAVPQKSGNAIAIFGGFAFLALVVAGIAVYGIQVIKEMTSSAPGDAVEEVEAAVESDASEDAPGEAREAGADEEDDAAADASADLAPAPTPAPAQPRTAPAASTAPAAAAAAPEPAAPPPANQAVALGVSSMPMGLEYVIDGSIKGKTPKQNVELMPGTHTIQFLKGGEVQKETTVTVQPDTQRIVFNGMTKQISTQ
jgi:hypothetical protein